MKKLFTSLLVVLFLAVFVVGLTSGFRTKIRYFSTDKSRFVLESLHSVGNKTKKVFSFVFTISNLKKQNQELSDKILSLEVDKSQISELETENKLLKKELGFLDANDKSALIPAKIIEREPTSFLDSFVIDKGKNDGVIQGNAIVSGGALVGCVSQVYDFTSMVVLITSKDSIIQAMLQESRSKGVLKGGISGLYIENIMLDTEYNPGEAVVTSGLGGKMKQGILIGKAMKTQNSSSGIFKSITVEPAVDLSKLELVFVQK